MCDMVTFSLSALWSPSLTDVVVSVSFQVAVVEKTKRDADIEDPETRKSPSSLYLLPSQYVGVCVCVRGCVCASGRGRA